MPGASSKVTMRPASVTIAAIVKKTNCVNPDLSSLETILCYTFTDRSLLERAITHRSWAHEQVAPGQEEAARRLHNEALEFVGDSVLGLVVADFLFQSYPDRTEGELSRMKHQLVSAASLAKAAKRLCLGEYVRVGRGEEKTGGRRKSGLLADIFEAMLAAIFQDGGLVPAAEFIYHALGDELARADPEAAAAADFKTALQERLQAQLQTTPQYAVIETKGPPHRRTFHVEVCWAGGSMRGEGCSIKLAEACAARRALESMSREPQVAAH